MWAEDWQQVPEGTGVRREELGFQAQEPELCLLIVGSSRLDHREPLHLPPNLERASLAQSSQNTGLAPLLDSDIVQDRLQRHVTNQVLSEGSVPECSIREPGECLKPVPEV